MIGGAAKRQQQLPVRQPRQQPAKQGRIFESEHHRHGAGLAVGYLKRRLHAGKLRAGTAEALPGLDQLQRIGLSSAS